jgi:uncharacterized protein (DUF1778 family)
MTYKYDKTPTAVIALRCTPEEKAALVEAAQRDRRTLTAYMIAAGLEKSKKIQGEKNGNK